MENCKLLCEDCEYCEVCDYREVVDDDTIYNCRLVCKQLDRDICYFDKCDKMYLTFFGCLVIQSKKCKKFKEIVF